MDMIRPVIKWNLGNKFLVFPSLTYFDNNAVFLTDCKFLIPKVHSIDTYNSGFWLRGSSWVHVFLSPISIIMLILWKHKFSNEIPHRFWFCPANFWWILAGKFSHTFWVPGNFSFLLSAWCEMGWKCILKIKYYDGKLFSLRILSWIFFHIFLYEDVLVSFLPYQEF